MHHCYILTLQELEHKLVQRLKARHETERELKKSPSKLVNSRIGKLPPIKYHKRLVHNETPVVFGAN